MKGRDAGLGIVDAMVVVGLVMVVSTVALVQMRTSVSILDADKASNLVMSQLRYARQVAVDQRRNVRVDFIGSGRITVTRSDPGGAETVMANVTLPGGFVFGLPNGPADTPEGYGNTNPVFFSNATNGTFLGDGTFVTAAGILTNGSVFTILGGNGSARAVTLNGASGRLKHYYLKGNQWVIRG